MAQRPIREAQAKALIAANWPVNQPGKPEIRFASIDPETDLNTLPEKHSWLNLGRIAAKADEMFGRRGKLGYVKFAENWEEAKNWIQNFRGKEVMIGDRIGKLEHFLLEPYIEHQTEYYLAFTCERENDVIYFSDKGGVDIEEQEDAITTIKVPVNSTFVRELWLGTRELGLGNRELEIKNIPTSDSLPVQQAGGRQAASRPNPESRIPGFLTSTIQTLFQLFRGLDFTYLEFNPITEAGGRIYLLDAVARVDSSAASRQKEHWGGMKIPPGFGTAMTAEEERIMEMDSKSGSSLKFVLLNPNGRIWTMVAGGGASIIYADAITAQTDPKELANYGEWSGNPSADEMEAYTNEILTLIEKNPREQALLIGGGIANFTDIKSTFDGIIKALRRHSRNLKQLKIFVRRAGPHDTEGLKAIKDACGEMGLNCIAFGAELPMTDIVGMAIDAIGIRSIRESGIGIGESGIQNNPESQFPNSQSKFSIPESRIPNPDSPIPNRLTP